MLFLLLGVAGIIGGAAMISLGNFGDTMIKCTNASAVWNDTCVGVGPGCCVNATQTNETLAGGAANAGTTAEWNATVATQNGMLTIAQQFPTIAIIAVMVVIIGLISGAFVYFAYFK